MYLYPIYAVSSKFFLVSYLSLKFLYVSCQQVATCKQAAFIL